MTLGDRIGSWTGASHGPGEAPSSGAGASSSQFGPDETLLPPNAPSGPEAPHTNRAALHLVVAELQPANIYHSPSEPPRPAGQPPQIVIGAAALCGILAVPMLATAGSLFAGASRGNDAIDVLLSLVTLGLAIGAVVGALRLTRQGSPLLALVTGTFTVIGTLSNLIRLAHPTVLDTLMFVVWAVFGAIALIMVGLLRTRRARRWLSARSREWQASRPPSRRRFRVQLPRPRLRLRTSRSFRVRSSRRARTRRVRQVGRHTRHAKRSRFGRSKRPVSFVGSQAPDQQ